MRLHAEFNHPDFRPFSRVVEVLLDGKILKECICADDERGEATIYVTDDSGDLIVEEGDCKISVLKGDVQIRADHAYTDKHPELYFEYLKARGQ